MHWDTNTDTNAYIHPVANGYRHSYSYNVTDTYIHSVADTYRDGHSRSHASANTHTGTQCQSNDHAGSDSDTYPGWHAKPNLNSAASGAGHQPLDSYARSDG